MAELFDDDIQFDDDDEFGGEGMEDSAERDLELINAESAPAGEQVSTQELERLRQMEAIVNQFNANPQGALQQIAQQLGYEVQPAGHGARVGEKPAASPSRTSAQDGFSIDEIANEIEDENLRFLAPVIAKVADKIAEKRLEPIRQSQNEIHQRSRQQEYVTAAQELSRRYPDWQRREQDMQDRLKWMQSALSGGPLTHHRYGNLLEVLYTMASGRDNARRDVAAEYRDAPNHRAVSSSSNEARQPDILQIIAKAPRKDHAKLAFDAAVKEVFG